MAYITIREYGEDSFIEKKSEFIGYAKRVENEEEAKAFVAEIKSKHKQARHNCWAYIIGENMGIQRYSDDGEPQGTAGIPILEVMKKADITDCAVVVTRYFGGILLGTGGLVKAYTQATLEALGNAVIVEKDFGQEVKFAVNYADFEKLKYYLKQSNIGIISSEYDANVNVIVEISKGKLEKMLEQKENFNFKLLNYQILRQKFITVL